ncbi:MULTISPECIES: peroxiredoxin [Sinorhizobium]|jgi:peroxiredoxin Q/BCP|uniref:peroxiredoxin n=1 Tax=Sinorhizobium TaxID=28105 RepID=UPI00038067C4|nr:MULTISPECIES: peroxiredoxin [Sinorhizobium]PND21959.1 peroxiredoxin [Ensifer sp. MMN_5]PND29362.1 peroxiredoxin [Sinorhizobium sp. M4_45]RVQ01577.1 peroxiredoxin [Sinorhizobium meliloti]
MAGLGQGDIAPEFELPRDGGGSIALAALRGKPIVLFFYPKDDTKACTEEAIAFSALQEEFQEAGIALVGISPDSAKSHDRFTKKHDLTVALGADEDKAVANAYGVWVEKSMYGRKYMGVERTTFLIDRQGVISRVWEKVKVPGHADEVLAAAKAL